MKFYAVKGNLQYTLTNEIDVEHYKAMGFKIIDAEAPKVVPKVEPKVAPKVTPVKVEEKPVTKVKKETNKLVSE